MRIILAFFLILLLLFPASVIGEVKTINHSVKQAFGGSQTPDDARIAAVAKAKREALEMAGTYIESLTVLKNKQVDKDEILALTAGVLKAEVVSQKNYASDDAFGIDVVVKVVVDTSVLDERVKKLFQDRIHLLQLKEAQKREKVLLQKVVQLEKENEKLTAKQQSNRQLKKQFQQVSRGLTAVEWFYRADALWDGKKYTDPKKAIEYLNNAIKLKPDETDVYYTNRGNAFFNLGQYQRAIKDYNEAIRLEPKYANAYYNRGIVYDKLKQYQRAIPDYDVAISLKPDFVEAYQNRGIDYYNLGQCQRAVNDFNEAIRLNPDVAATYTYRGMAYARLEQVQQALQDFDIAIRLEPTYADAYYNRGILYLSRLRQYQQAIQDYSSTINLKPDFAEAYNDRGAIYNDLGRYDLAIEDFNTAIRLKPEHADAYHNRSIAYVGIRQYSLSLKDIDKAILLKPKDPMYYVKRGNLYVTVMNNKARGCHDFKDACKLANRLRVETRNPLDNKILTLDWGEVGCAIYKQLPCR